MIELDKAYDASKYEADIYKQWMDSGYFNPDNLPGDGKPYTIMLPPPNVTGTLHIGSALMLVIQDILTRYHRMLGRKTLWLPGTDHAAIATQSKVEKILQKEEGKRRHDYGREEFLKRVEDFAQNSQSTIIEQIKGMGSSVDWSRLAYTLDEKRSLAVRTAFKAMYDDGLIYRGNRVINWDPKGQTVISDDEIVYQERPAKLYTFKYSADFPISISTTRPETKVGDTAVAVHPDDERYQQYVGKEYDAQFAGVPIHIKIIADKEVDKEFGTGALGVTPAHSMIDFEIAQNHGLPLKQVIDEFAKMTVGGENLLGKKTTEARETVVEWLREQNLLEKEEDITQNVATAERTGGIIEPLPKLQWFIDVNRTFLMKHSEIEGIKEGQEVTLKQLMRHVVETNQIKITPANYSKIYFHWIDNLRDWCISRQLWYGHRIPVWYRGEDMYVGIDAPEGEGWEQDSDTLDTWFSSGLWTFSTLGWPEQTTDLAKFHPTDVLETGYDILFFWVARMILMTTYHVGQVPFRDVYLHGLVRDAKNRKMSKSNDNIIDPLEMNAKYGADATRFALVFNTAPGTDTSLAEDKIKGMKHFANKIWNIARFILQNVDEKNIGFKNNDGYDNEDQSIIEQLGLLRGKNIETALTKESVNSAIVVDKVTKHLEDFRLHEAAQTLYNSIWYDFADKYIEHSKPKLSSESSDTKRVTKTILYESLVTYLKLLHPFMPFLTETIWSEMGKKDLLISDWPKSDQ